MRIRPLLAGGQAMAAIYFATLVVAAIFNPGISSTAQAPSMLGTAPAPYPWIYNTGMILTALAGVACAIGLALGLRQIGSHPILVALLPLTVLLPSISFGMAGFFPLPNPLHYGYNLTLAFLFVPLLGALALWRRDRPQAVAALLVAFVAGAALFAAVLGIVPLVNATNAGLWLRVLALLYLWAVAFISLRVARVLPTEGA